MLAKTAEEEMGENVENYLDALNAFERKPSREIPSELEQLLCRIARNGEPLFPWSKLKPLVTNKLENVIQEYIQSNPCEEVPMLPNVENIKFDDMRDRLLRALNAFNSAPFTMQRLCELLTQPKRYYQRSDKFMRGIEKNVQVVSTVTPTGKRITHSCEVRNRSLIMNGFPSDIHTQTSTPSLSDSQPSGQPVSSGETSHTNGETVTDSQQPDNGTVAATCTSTAQEESIDSTRQSVSPAEPESELVSDTNQRTSTDSTSEVTESFSSGTNSDKECSESTSNEAEACKPMDVAETTGGPDSDDSDGNKGDADQDSCSSLDSADSGDSSPDSALPPRSGYFDSLPPKDNAASSEPTCTQTHTGAETVESTSVTQESPAQDKATTPEQHSDPPADQSHSSIPTPGQEQQASPLVTSTVTGNTDTKTDQPEAATETAKEAEPEPSEGEPVPSEGESDSTNQLEAPPEKASQSESSSEEIGELTEEPMEHD